MLKEYRIIFLKNNYEIVSNPKDSDIIILSCCSYLNKNANDSLALTKKFLDYNAELIITGCFPETDKEELKKNFNGQTISTSSLNKIDEIFPENKVKFSDIDDANIPLENINEHVLLGKLKNNFGKSKSMEKIFHGISEPTLNNLIKDDSVDCHKTIVNYG